MGGAVVEHHNPMRLRRLRSAMTCSPGRRVSSSWTDRRLEVLSRLTALLSVPLALRRAYKRAIETGVALRRPADHRVHRRHRRVRDAAADRNHAGARHITSARNRRVCVDKDGDQGLTTVNLIPPVHSHCGPTAPCEPAGPAGPTEPPLLAAPTTTCAARSSDHSAAGRAWPALRPPDDSQRPSDASPAAPARAPTSVRTRRSPCRRCESSIRWIKFSPARKHRTLRGGGSPAHRHRRKSGCRGACRQRPRRAGAAAGAR